jgi:hypothetical protein
MTIETANSNLNSNQVILGFRRKYCLRLVNGVYVNRLIFLVSKQRQEFRKAIFYRDFTTFYPLCSIPGIPLALYPKQNRKEGNRKMVEKTGVLDGKTFLSEFGKKHAKTEGNDELVFKNGKFRSIACDPYGFGEGAYTFTVNGEAITFEPETFSTSEGKIKWIGTVKGNTLKGSFTWHRLGKWYRVNRAPLEYWVKGELKADEELIEGLNP